MLWFIFAKDLMTTWKFYSKYWLTKASTIGLKCLFFCDLSCAVSKCSQLWQDNLLSLALELKYWLPSMCCFWFSFPRLLLAVYRVDSHQSFENWILCITSSLEQQISQASTPTAIVLSSRMMSRHIKLRFVIRVSESAMVKDLVWSTWDPQMNVFTTHIRGLLSLLQQHNLYHPICFLLIV